MMVRNYSLFIFCVIVCILLISCGGTKPKLEVPGKVRLSAPNNNATSQSTTLAFSWEPVDGATNYRIQVSTAANFSSPAVDESVNALTYTATLQTGTNYHWRVQASNSDGSGEWSEVRTFETEAPPSQALDKVMLSTPDVGATSQPTTLTFSWVAVTGATAYRIHVSTAANFSSTAVNESVTATQHTATLQASMSYHWRVRASKGSINGAWSDVRMFTTAAPASQAPGKVTLAAPSNDTTGQDLNITFSWNSVNMATLYTIQADRDTAFNAPELSAELSNTTYDYILKYDTTYYWRVRASNSVGNGPWSERWTFQTAGNRHMGNLELGTQAQINALRSFSYTKITGNLSIQEDSPGAITDLSPLSTVTSVWGELIISINTALDSLSGLSNIASVGHNISISRNAALTSLSGLSGLTSVGGNININDNAALTSLSGLDGVTFLSGNLSISGNGALTNYCAIRHLITNGQVDSSEYFISSRSNGYGPSYENIQNEGSGGCQQ